MPVKRAKAETAENDVVVIKKYANRRLYNTGTSGYVTLDDLRKMVQQDIDFQVIDAKTGEDLTRAVLAQIIVEEESRGQSLLPISFLRQIIAMYEDNMRWTLPQYLETAMNWYGDNQKNVQQSFASQFSGMMPPGMEELQRNQMAMFDQAMRMFTPSPPPAMDEPEPVQAANTDAASEKADIDSLKDQIAALQQAVEGLARKQS